MKRRSLRDLDESIEEIIRRNPDFMLQLDKVVNEEKAKIDERSMGRKVSSENSK
jgi:hypothetical protein